VKMSDDDLPPFKAGHPYEDDPSEHPGAILAQVLILHHERRGGYYPVDSWLREAPLPDLHFCLGILARLDMREKVVKDSLVRLQDEIAERGEGNRKDLRKKTRELREGTNGGNM